MLYTGGPRPYGYEGLGEVFVFLFFGIVAVTGSYFVQVQELPWQAFVCAVPVGLLASAILVVNNVRDLETDRRAGKRTLAVRLGRERTRALYARCSRVAFLARAAAVAARLDGRLAAAAWAAIPLAVAVVRVVRTRTDGPSLNGALAKTGRPAARLLPAVLRRDPRRRRHLAVKLELERRTLRLAAPLQTAYGEVARARAADRGRSPARTACRATARRRRCQPTTASASSACSAALESYRPALAELRVAATARSCSTPAAAIEDLPAALAAIDLALWDRAGRRAGKPVAPLLSDDPAPRVPVNATLDGARPSRRGRAGRGGRRSRASPA